MLDTVGEVACAVVVIGGVQIVPFAVGAIVLEVVIVVILVGDNRVSCQCWGHKAQQHENGQHQAEGFPIPLHFDSPLLSPAGNKNGAADPRLGLGWRPLNTSKGSLDVELFVFRLVFIFLGW